MKQSHKKVGSLVPSFLVLSAMLAACWCAGVWAHKERVDGARALSAKRKQIDERAAPALRAAMPALQSLAFEANEGQVDSSVKFLARSGGHQLQLTARSIILRSPRGSVGIEFAGANGSGSVTGIDLLPGQRNYLIGNDPKTWHTGIPTFQRVQYSDLYPGIDLAFYGNQNEFEYDFIVR